MGPGAPHRGLLGRRLVEREELVEHINKQLFESDVETEPQSKTPRIPIFCQLSPCIDLVGLQL